MYRFIALLLFVLMAVLAVSPVMAADVALSADGPPVDQAYHYVSADATSPQLVSEQVSVHVNPFRHAGGCEFDRTGMPAEQPANTPNIDIRPENWCDDAHGNRWYQSGSNWYMAA